MALREEMSKQGEFLFRWRSYLPLLALPVFAIALRDSEYLKRTFGDAVDNAWEIFCVAVSFAGLAIRCFVAGYAPRGTSGRNTKDQVAETLNTKGMYSIVRNPLYLGNFVIMLGIFFFVQVWWFVLVSTAGFLLYYERIIFVEEEFLRAKFGDVFLNWAQGTPIFFPRFGNWQKPDLPFSGKTVLRREFSTFIAIVAFFFFLDAAADFITVRKIVLDAAWVIFFSVSLTIYFILLFLKKRTKILDVQGR